MGQKVNPHGLRVGVIKEWDSKWDARDQNIFKEKIIQRRNLQNRDRESFRSREDHCLYS